MTPWLTVAEADSYFETRLGADKWASASAETKLAALTTAQRDIENCGLFTFDAIASGESGTESQQAAVCEQALFRLIDTSMDNRAALRAQGVIEAGVVHEKYQGRAGVPIWVPIWEN